MYQERQMADIYGKSIKRRRRRRRDKRESSFTGLEVVSACGMVGECDWPPKASNRRQVSRNAYLIVP